MYDETEEERWQHVLTSSHMANIQEKYRQKVLVLFHGNFVWQIENRSSPSRHGRLAVYHKSQAKV